jgi:hypothetical protein
LAHSSMKEKPESTSQQTRSSARSEGSIKHPKRWTLSSLAKTLIVCALMIFVVSVTILNIWMSNGGLTKVANNFCKKLIDPYCHIEDVRASIGSGFKIVNILIPGNSVDLPSPDSQSPLLKIGEIRFRFKWTSLLRLLIDVEELVLENLNTALVCGTQSCNFSEITEKFEAQPKQEAEPTTAKTSLSQLVSKIAATKSPIGLRIANLGLRNSNITVKSQGRLGLKDIDIRGLNLLINTEAILPRAQLGIDFGFEQIIVASTRINKQNAVIRLLAEIEQSKNQISILNFSASIAELLSFNSKLSLATVDKESGIAETAGSGEFAVDLTNIGRELAFLFPQFNLNGKANLVFDLPVQRIKLDDLPDHLKKQIPQLSAKLELNGIGLKTPSGPVRLNLENSNSSISLNVKDSESRSPTVEVTAAIEVPDVSVESESAIRNLRVKDTRLEMSAALSPLDMKILDFKIRLMNKALSVVSRHQTLSTTQVNLNLNGKIQDRMQADVDLDVEKLIKIVGSGSGNQEKGEVDAQLQIKLADLATIDAIARPILQLIGMAEVLPKSMSGAIAAKISAKGRDLQSFKYKHGEITNSKEAEFDLATDVQLSKISILDRVRDLTIKDLDLDVNLSAKPGKQSLAISSRSGQLRIGPELMRATKIEEIELLGTNLKIGINNQFPKDRMNLASAKSSVRLEHKTATAKINAQKKQYESPIEIDLAAYLHSKSTVRIENLEARVPSLRAKAGVQGKIDFNEGLEPQNIEAALNFELENVESLAAIGDIKTSGTMRAAMSGKSDLKSMARVEGRLEFENLNLHIGEEAEKPQVKVVGLSGTLPFRQHFLVDNLRRTAEILSARKTADEKVNSQAKKSETLQSRMRRYLDARSSNRTASSSVVDYNSQKPARKEDLQLRAEKVSLKGFVADNINIDLEIKQNYLSLNEFNAQILGGSVQGSTFVAFNELNPEVDATLHFTGINTRNLLNDFPAVKRRASSWNLLADPFIGGAINLKVDLVNRELNGRMDLTQVGLEQVRMTLYYLDPNQKDPSIKSVIQILNAAKLVAGIERVSVPIESGLIDMIIQMRLAGAPIPLPKIQQFPLGKLISNIVSEKLQKVDEVESSDAH